MKALITLVEGCMIVGLLILIGLLGVVMAPQLGWLVEDYERVEVSTNLVSVASTNTPLVD